MSAVATSSPQPAVSDFGEPTVATTPAVRAVKFACRDDGPVQHLGELVIIVRNEFRLANTMTDNAILESLKLVASPATPRDRWLALFKSPLGSAIAALGRDLNTAMGFVLAQLPKQSS